MEGGLRTNECYMSVNPLNLEFSVRYVPLGVNCMRTGTERVLILDLILLCMHGS